MLTLVVARPARLAPPRVSERSAAFRPPEEKELRKGYNDNDNDDNDNNDSMMIIMMMIIVYHILY